MRSMGLAMYTWWAPKNRLLHGVGLPLAGSSQDLGYVVFITMVMLVSPLRIGLLWNPFQMAELYGLCQWG